MKFTFDGAYLTRDKITVSKPIDQEHWKAVVWEIERLRKSNKHLMELICNLKSSDFMSEEE